MKLASRTGRSVLLILLVALVAALALAAAVALPGRAAAQPAGDYLALGDSVTFGYREPTNPPPPDYSDAASFVGYPSYVAAATGLRVVNASCPGETSVSLVKAGAPSNGCENEPGGGPGYRTAYPLHKDYSGTQLAFAVKFLRAHPQTRLVTLMIGANDGFLCQETTADQCASELPGVLAQIGNDVARTLATIRGRAGYQGQIVIVNYYSLDYSSAAQNASSRALNAAMDKAAAPYAVQTANGYKIFARAAASSGGDSCAAGLLTTLTGGGCGVHPSARGQQLLARVVEAMVLP